MSEEESSLIKIIFYSSSKFSETKGLLMQLIGSMYDVTMQLANSVVFVKRYKWKGKSKY